MDISIRELKANPGAAIKRVQAGERVRITAHRKVVAELVAPQSGEVAPVSGEFQTPSEAERAADREAIQQLIDSGLVSQPATQPFELPKPIKIPPGPDGQTMSDLVIEMRGPR